MSNRIQEIYLECYKPYSTFDYDKFANLIVQDIIKIVDGYVETSPEIMGLPLDILEHFDMEYNEND